MMDIFPVRIDFAIESSYFLRCFIYFSVDFKFFII